MNFLLMELTHLRYWMPLVIEGNKRGIKSTFYVGKSGKYNCPSKKEPLLQQLAEEHNINMLPMNEISNAKGLLFSSEKTGIKLVEKAKDTKKIVCTYQTDFIESYKNYVDVVDHVLMPSQFCADYYNLSSKKNLFLGIPKYDTKIEKSTVHKKYSLPENQKYVTLISPKVRDQSLMSWNTSMMYLHDMGYKILFKTRGKDAADHAWIKQFNKLGHYYFEDNSWYPHTTQELLEVSDFAINFGSTTIEECVMQNVPLINFDIKPEFRNGSKRPYRVTHDYLYKYNYCVEMYRKDNAGGMPTPGEFKGAVQYLLQSNLDSEFKKARQNHLFDHKDSCKRILDALT